jgi:tetratricopeptide (TPR) repeat protein
VTDHDHGGSGDERTSAESTVELGGPPLPGPVERTDPRGAAPPPTELSRGSMLGRYVVVAKLGAGTMGVVYRGYDPELDRRVAIKVVAVRGGMRKRVAEIRTRLLREAQALARVGHPNVIQVFDVGDAAFAGEPMRGRSPAVFVAMEYIDGLTLRQWLASQPRSWREIVEVFVQAGRGLAAAHAADLIHRDFKPDNVMIGRTAEDGGTTGRVRVLDFGLARATAGGVESAPESEEFGELAQHPVDFDDALTQDGTILGTPAYMAPELHTGGAAGPASDQFAFCVALWEALHGQRPFAGDTHAAIAFNILQGRTRAPSNERAVPRWLQRLLARGLALEPAQRFASMTSLVDELARDRGRMRRRVAVVVALGGVAAAAYFAPRAPPGPSACPSSDERLAATWSPARRDAIGERFAASGLPFARESWASAAKLLDAHATLWQAERVDACRATHERAEQSSALMDLRMACLDRDLEQFAALLQLFEAAERDAVIGAVDAARALSDLAECRDTQALVSRQPPPRDPEVRARADALQRTLVGIDALVDAGAFQQARPQLAAVREEVLGIGWAPLSQQMFSLHAAIELATGATATAADAWEQSFAEALVAGEPRRAAFVASKLAYVGSRLADVERGRSWARIGHTLLRAFEDDGRVEVALWSAEGALATTAGDYEAGLAAHQRVLDYWQAREPDSPEMAVALGNVGTLQRILGRPRESVELARRELAIAQASYGERHPDTAVAMRHLAFALGELGEHEPARGMLELALAIHRESQGGANAEVAAALDELGRMERRLGKLREAEAHHREALALWRQELGEGNPEVAVSWMNVGYTQLAADDFAGALESFTQAGVIVAGLGPDHPHAVFVANASAKALLGLHRAPQAVSRLREALASKAGAQVDPTLLAETRFLLAKALAEQPGGRAEAIALATTARDSYAASEAAGARWGQELAEIDEALQRWRK